MSDSKLPQVRDKTLPSKVGSRLLPVGGFSALAASGLLFYVVQSAAASALMAVIGVVLIFSSKLVNKSLALTSSTAELSLPEKQIAEIAKQVSKCKFLEHVESEGTKAASQAHQLQQQYNSLSALLKTKFEPGELTATRYQGAIDSLCLAVAENLLKLKHALENLSNSRASSDSESWTREIESSRSILSTNENALLELSSLYTSINSITTKERHRDQLDESIDQIKRLTEQAKKYSST